MATRLTYNGIDLGLVRTMKVEQTAKYDPHNTDVLYVLNRFSVETILSTLPIGAPGGALWALVSPAGIDDDRPADIMKRIRMALLLPRRAFKYSQVDEGGETVLLEATADTEADNGPKPRECIITQVADRTWRIEWEIDVAVQDCTAYQQFASNRFETTHDIDERGYSTLTTQGRVFVRSDMKRSPDALRPVITPPVPRGFRRKSSYSLAHDGLSMEYKFVDAEFFLSPPRNAVAAKGRFSITTVPPGAVMWAQVDVRLEARKDTPKRQLMEMAVLMALRRLEAADIVRDPIRGKPFVMGGALSEELWDNAVEVQLRGQIRVGGNLVGPNEGFQFWRGVWRGIFFGGAGNIGASVGAAAGNGEGVFSAVWRFGKGLFSPSKDEQAAAIAKAKAQAAGAAAMEAALQAGNQAPPNGADPPQVFGATFEGDLLDRFGAPLVGVPQHARRIDPGLRGNLDWLALVAAAFRDPCVVEPLIGLVALNPGLAVAQGLTGFGSSANSDDRGGRTVAYLDHLPEPGGFQTANGAWNSHELGALVNYYNNIGDPALDWRGGRLRSIEVGSGLAGGLIINEVEQLPKEQKRLPESDDFPGWYDNYYCEVKHSLAMHQDVLPATVKDIDAIKVRWANPVRTIEVRWAMVKAGFPPEIPVISGDPNIVVLEHTMALPTFEIAGDGQTPIWSTTGFTVYKALSEKYIEVHYPVPPWLKAPMRYMPAPIPDTSLVFDGPNADNSSGEELLSSGGSSGGSSTLVSGGFPRIGV